jgi:hypothetical protein
VEGRAMLNRFVIWMAVSAFAFSGQAYSRDLTGEWRVDFERTLEFSDRHLRKSGAEGAIHKCVARNSKLYISDVKLAYFVSEHECRHGDRASSIEAFSSEFLYDVIYAGANETVLLVFPEGKKESRKLHTVNWIDDDLFWVDESDADIFSRYYYRRVPSR